MTVTWKMSLKVTGAKLLSSLSRFYFPLLEISVNAKPLSEKSRTEHGYYALARRKETYSKKASTVVASVNRDGKLYVIAEK